MIDKLISLFKLDENEVVRYNDLSNVKPGIWHNLFTNEECIKDKDLTPSVWYKRFSTKVSGQQIYISRIFKGFGYHYHSHDCKETITPINGTLMVNDNIRKLIVTNQVETFYKNTRHKLDYHDSDNAKYVDVFVEFIKDLKSVK